MKRIHTAVVLLTVDLLLLFWTRNMDGLAEWYSTCIYPVWVNLLGRLCGKVSFSVAEVLLYLLITMFLVGLFRFWGKVFFRRGDAAGFLKNSLFWR